MKAGIVIVAFGKDYERLAAASIKYSQQFTDLPFHVMVAGDKPPSFFDGIENISFTAFNKHQKDNRKIKLNLPQHSPFGLTLYMDCDAIIQKKGCEVFIDLLKDKNAVFNQRVIFKPGQKIWNIYRRCMDQFGVEKPIAIHNGGLFAFRKSEDTLLMFRMWHQMWEEFGAGREMPPLNCAIKKSKIEFNKFPRGYFADNSEQPFAVIQHCWHLQSYARKFGLPTWREFKPFDRGNSDDFRFEKDPK